MEIIVLPIILLPIFIVLVSSTKFPPWKNQDQNYDVIFNDDDEQGEMIPREDMGYGNPLKSAWNEDSDYEYYWSFVPQPKIQNSANLPAMEKKQGHAETTLCMSTLVHRTYKEEKGFDFKPDALTEYDCQAVPSRIYNNWEHLPERATICKVKGECLTREREIRVFKKKRNTNRNEANCWQQEHYNLSVGCLCLNHFYH